MNLNEAIKHCEEKAEELRTEAEQLRDIGEVMSNPKQPYNEPVKNCLECANEHEQLAEWLEELKTLRKAYAMACEDIERRAPYPKAAAIIAEDWERFYIKKAREEND